MSFFELDGGKAKKAKPKAKKSTKSKSSVKKASKSKSKKGGNFLGTVSELFAPAGWENFVTAAGLLALDRTDNFLRKKNTSKKQKGGNEHSDAEEHGVKEEYHTGGSRKRKSQKGGTDGHYTKEDMDNMDSLSEDNDMGGQTGGRSNTNKAWTRDQLITFLRFYKKNYSNGKPNNRTLMERVIKITLNLDDHNSVTDLDYEQAQLLANVYNAKVGKNQNRITQAEEELNRFYKYVTAPTNQWKFNLNTFEAMNGGSGKKRGGGIFNANNANAAAAAAAKAAANAAAAAADNAALLTSKNRMNTNKAVQANTNANAAADAAANAANAAAAAAAATLPKSNNQVAANAAAAAAAAAQSSAQAAQSSAQAVQLAANVQVAANVQGVANNQGGIMSGFLGGGKKKASKKKAAPKKAKKAKKTKKSKKVAPKKK